MRINEGNPAATVAFCRESMTTSTGSSDDDSSTIPQSPLPLTAFSIEDYAYRGEGNANVVVALPKEYKVIRFRKSLPDDVSPDGGKQRVEREVEFVRFVAACFLGTYTQIPEILRYDVKDVAKLSEAIRPFRPDNRRSKEITGTYATKFPNYTFLQTNLDSDIFRSNDTYCVEIKPKQGYLRDIDRKFQKCPYCLSQYYKLKKKTIGSRSSYCPFDLFSGVEERMKSALRGLLKSPQNNLKIFKNGLVAYDHESTPSDLEPILTECFSSSINSTNEEYIDKFCSLISSALLHPFISEEHKTSPLPTREFYTPAEQDFKAATYINADLIAKAKKFLYFVEEECNLKVETLPNNSVLERILRMQRLSFTSSDYIYNTYLKLRPFLTDDIIYNNLIKMHNTGDHEIPYSKQKKIIAKNTERLRETYIETRAKDSSIAKKPIPDDYNGNKDINRPNDVVSFVPNGISFPVHSEKNHLCHNKSSTIHNRGDTYFNENGTHISVNIESILCLQNYLLFSCARDCSILMSFREINPNAVSSHLTENIIQLPDGLSFLFNIQISDLDPKSLHCIEKHRQRDICALNSVISVVEEELIVKNHSTLEDRLSQ